MPSCRECDGPAAPAGITSLSSDAAPCSRAECATGQRHQHALHLFRALRHQAMVQSVRRASSTSRQDISFERCGAMPSCQVGSPTVLPTACATGPQRPQAQNLLRAARSHAIAPVLLSRAVAPEAGLWRGGTCLPAQCRRCPGGAPAESCRFADAGSGYGRSLPFAGLAPGVPALRAAVGAGEKGPQHLPDCSLSRAWLRRTLLREGVCVGAAACLCGRGQWRQVEWQSLRRLGASAVPGHATACREVVRSAAAPGIALGPATPVRAFPAGASNPSRASPRGRRESVAAPGSLPGPA